MSNAHNLKEVLYFITRPRGSSFICTTVFVWLVGDILSVASVENTMLSRSDHCCIKIETVTENRSMAVNKETKIGTGKPRWVEDNLGKIEIHGLPNWYHNSESRIVRSFIGILAIVLLFGLPILAIVQFVDFISTNQIKTEIEEGRGTMFRYPNLTVCRSKYFDSQLLSGKCSILV